MKRKLPKPIHKADIEAALFAAEIGDVPTLDLHGQLHVESALHDVSVFVDQAFFHGDEAIRIIHGRGTGKLRAAVHAWLKKHPLYVASYRDAMDIPGMGGVTVVALHRR